MHLIINGVEILDVAYCDLELYATETETERPETFRQRIATACMSLDTTPGVRVGDMSMTPCGSSIRARVRVAESE